MSENVASVVANPKKSYRKLIIIALSIMVLLLIYGAGFIGLPVTVLTHVRDRDCDAVLSLNRIYTSLYPRFIQDVTLSAPVGECAAYLSATAKEKNGIWQEAFDAYQGYSNAYPGGMYSKEAHEHAAQMLMNIVQEEIETEKYGDALTHLNQIVSGYSDTSPCTEAWTLFPEVYTSWGTAMRDAGNFEGAERLFHEFETWIQANEKTELAVDAQRGLAQTFLAWGLSFKSQKQYENALAKFDLAIAADPQAQLDTTAQVKAGQRKVYIEWGNDLLTQDQFSVAIEKYQLAASHAEGSSDGGVGDALANGHIQWALDLSANEDFLASLEHLKTAKETALSDDMKKSAEAAFGETYLAFSKSTGPQARRAMKDVPKTICEKHKVPDLPIFGLNKEVVRFGIYGVEDPLPENLTAKTPGEMHYVACIKTDNKTIDSQSKRKIVLQFSRGYFYVIVQQFRVQVFWNADLLRTDTVKSVAETSLKGDEPPPFPSGDEDSGNYFYGPAPLKELSDWLQSVTK